MPFPDIERVIYQLNPLIEVSFQVRFPRLLFIDSEPPAQFQRVLINDYPVYEQRNVIQVIFASGVSEAPSVSSETQGKTHAFLSSDRTWTVILAGDSIMLSSLQYVRWEHFKDRLRAALEAFSQTYQPPIFTRIGLRYQDVIRRSRLNLPNTSWRNLLAPHMAADLMTDAFSENDLVGKQTVLTVKLADSDILGLRHGLVTHKETNELAYLIDSDFYNEEHRSSDVNGALDVAERLHGNSSKLFRWCITDELHRAMQPQPVGQSN